MRAVVLAMITLYQRFVSPRKGFRCAYRVHTGRASCSALGFRAIRRHGVFKGSALVRQRLRLCGIAHRRHAADRALPPRRQRGDCDLGCDLPGDCSFSGRGLLQVCDCGSCDWFDRKRRKNDSKERYVHIPPDVRIREARGAEAKGRP